MTNLKKIYNTKSPVLEEMGFNDDNYVIIAGPCAIEDRESLLAYAKLLKDNNIHYMRAGAFKPRTSPYDFQGLGYLGLNMLKEIRELTGIKVVSEIVNADDVKKFEETVDIIQVGTRNAQNFELLKALGKTTTPVLLKRGFGNTIDEWLSAAEYILASGNPNVILCERGLKSIDGNSHNILDLGGAILVKKLTKLPVIIDPSHASKIYETVPELTWAGLTAGLNGALIEIHFNPDASISDSAQALRTTKFSGLLEKARKISAVLDKKIY